MGKRRRYHALLGCPVLALFVIAACAPVTINSKMLVPGNSDQASQIKKVAVLPFDGPEGKEFAAEIEGKLASIIVNDKPYFAMVDRVTMDKILSEMRLSMTGIVDPTTATQVGKMVGAKGIYTGTITASTVNDTRYNEKRTRCASQVTKRDKKGNEYKECEKTEEYSVSCTKRAASFSFVPKLVEVETGKIIYSNTIEKQSTAAVCSDSEHPLASALEVKRAAKDAAKEDFRKDVAPYFVTMQIKLMDSTSDIDSKEAASKVKSGIEFAKNNRMDRGCELWGEAKRLSPKSLTILYNLGVCAEIAGRLDEAQSLYKESDRLLTKPDEKVSVALVRVSDAIEKRNKLNKQVQ